MRVFSHTCSNTEIVCALGCAPMLVGVDADSDYPPEVVAGLPKTGRDLDLDIDAVLALSPDLVLTSLTVPGHERVVAALCEAGLQVLVCDPLSLADAYADILRIADVLGVPERGRALVDEMDAAMPTVAVKGDRPKVLVEWWPKPVIAPARQSWVTDLIQRAGGRNPWGEVDAKSVPMEHATAAAAAPDVIVISWCGVKEANYRSEVVRQREGWNALPAVARDRIHAISEAYLGRPGPRLVEGYSRLREAIAAASAA
ncbi:MAG: ABC transporter substrate-binding protein [Thermomonas sp.]|uniref:ABC transporter substrate-binding protein n=1 Tax=Thermomonas sp. TaxID=1971895 RepID=UPI0026149A23|nr:helical backbone metal receptor [Thermomonas sp.]MCC7095867.1 ABC transporter substrate-binding protein [Thermomonas sp.]